MIWNCELASRIIIFFLGFRRMELSLSRIITISVSAASFFDAQCYRKWKLAIHQHSTCIKTGNFFGKWERVLGSGHAFILIFHLLLPRVGIHPLALRDVISGCKTNIILFSIFRNILSWRKKITRRILHQDVEYGDWRMKCWDRRK